VAVLVGAGDYDALGETTAVLADAELLRAHAEGTAALQAATAWTPTVLPERWAQPAAYRQRSNTRAGLESLWRPRLLQHRRRGAYPLERAAPVSDWLGTGPADVVKLAEAQPQRILGSRAA